MFITPLKVDLLFKNTKNYGDVTVLASWPEFQQKAWLAVLEGEGDAPVVNFIPHFRKVTGTDGTNTWPLSEEYFADISTAQYMADKYGTGELVEVPFGGSGGIFTASDKEYHVKFKSGRTVNAGVMAAFYLRNPETAFPGLAEKLLRAQLGKDGVLA